MNKILILALACFISGCSLTPYVKIDLDYATSEMKRVESNPVKIEVKVGVKDCLKYFSCGLFHRSQPWQGWPVNDEKEYYAQGAFISYEYVWE